LGVERADGLLGTEEIPVACGDEREAVERGLDAVEHALAP
jgi:hypothetical protein